MNRRLALCVVLGFEVACGKSTLGTAPAAAPAEPPVLPVASEAAEPVRSAAAHSSAGHETIQSAAAIPEPLPGKPPDVRFGELFERLSEKGGYYFSHNYVTNETSYLEVATVLMTRVTRGGGYVGVGPEQNFTYIALTQPSVAFVVDIRRRNALLHLLYKAIFDEAKSRAHFLSLLLSRPHDPASDPGEAANIEQVLAVVEKAVPEKAIRDANLQRWQARIEQDYGVRLKEGDPRELRDTLQAFFEGQLELAFEVDVPNAKKRAPFRQILKMTDPDGRQLGFLAREETFRYVQRMQRENRIVPVVGDFGGEHALRAIAAYMKEHGTTLSVFYASNVEEYLLDGNVFRKWVENVAAYPIDDKSLFVRAFLERKHHVHRAQRKGHRVATFAQPIMPFLARQREKPFKTWVQVAYDPAPLYAGSDAR